MRPYRIILPTLLFAGFVPVIVWAQSSVSATPRLIEEYRRLPLAFEKQVDASGERFVARGQGYAIGLDGGKVAIGVVAKDQTKHTVSLGFAGGQPGRAIPGPELPGKINYIRGNDPKKWQIGIPTYDRITYANTYPGIDVVYYGNGQQLEFDLVVKPGADPEAIRLKLEGARRLSIDGDGALVLGDAGGLKIALPRIYQEVNGAKKSVPGHYAIVARDEVAFRIDPWDHTRPLVIDPSIVYSTLFGGGLGYNAGASLALDPQGNIVIAGGTFAADFPTLNPAQKSLEATSSSAGDIFVSKIKADGTALIYSTYLGGSTTNGTNFMRVAVDSTGAAWVSGYALNDDDVPVVNAVQTTLRSANGNAYVARLNSTGVLEFSTYLGGTGGDLGIGMAVDKSNNGYVSGWTESSDFPTTTGALQTALNGAFNAFVAKFSPQGALLYSTLLGSGTTYGEAVAVDSLGSAYVTGQTNASAFPGAPAGGAQHANGGGFDAFVAKLNPGGTALSYFTFLGGAGTEGGTAIAVDPSFNAYIAGTTTSTGLATGGAAQTTLRGGTNAFVAKLNASGKAFTYVTYVGGNRVDNGGLNGKVGLALDASVPPNVYLTGSTDSTNFPTVLPLQSTLPENGTSLFRSTNSGGSFAAFDSNIPGVVFDASINPAGTSAVILTESGIYRTTDGGTTWTQQASGFTIANPFSHVARSPIAPKTLYVVGYNLASDSFNLTAFRSIDDGATWSTMGALPGGYLLGVMADPVSADTLYAFYFSSTSVFKSTNGGLTWNSSVAGLPAADVFSMTATSDGSLYAAGALSNFSNGIGVYKSINQGGSWTAVNTGLGTPFSNTYALSASGTTVYLAAGNVYETTNGGTNWTATAGGNIGASSISVSAQNPKVLYVITSSGTVLESSNGGASWSAPATGLPTSITEPIADPSNSTHALVFAPVNEAGYVAKLNSAGTQLLWSTYLGGTSPTYANAVATDNAGNVFVTGFTNGVGFPVTSSALPSGTPGVNNSQVFLTKISDATALCSTLTVDPAVALAPQNGGTLTFSVVAPSGCAWSAVSNESWAPTAGASGTGSGTFTVQIGSNSSGATRSANLTVGTGHVTITQPSNTCKFSLDKNSYPVGVAGGPVSAILTATAGCPWAVTNNYSSAITDVSPASGTGNATIGITVAANPYAGQRNFSLAVGTTSINIVQAAAALASQTISFDAIPDQILGISPFPIAVQASSGLALSLVSNTPKGAPPVCKLADDLVTLLTAGTCSITASQPGNAGYSAAASVTRTFTVSKAKPSGSFMAAPGSPVPVNNYPYSVAVGDFNLDGNPDLAAANYFGSSVTVLHGNGAGGFTPVTGSPFPVGALPTSVVVGDFNGDGNPDLAVTNSGSNNVTVLLGNGKGGFAPAAGSPFTVGPSPNFVAVGDFNGDGFQDLAAANGGSNNITVLLGNGAGGFTPAAGDPFPVGTNPYNLGVGDFNNDGIQDLAVANAGSNSVTVLLGDGAGGFTPAAGSPVPAGKTPGFLAVAVGDFNGDGNPDLAATSLFDGTVTVMLGNGKGAFMPAPGSPITLTPSPTSPISAVVGDFNGDGIQDLAVADFDFNNVIVLLGNGKGAFAPATGSPYAVGDGVRAIAVGDFNRDGIEDLATANSGDFVFYPRSETIGGNNISVLLGTLVGSTPQTITFPAPGSVTYGVAPFTIGATASSKLTVSFASTFVGNCTVAGTTVTITGAGTCSIVASQGGNATYAAAPTVVQSFTVKQAGQTLTFGALTNKTLGAAPFTLSASATSGLAVTFYSNTTAVCTVSGVTVTLLTDGTCSITATQDGNSNFLGVPAVTRTFTVTGKAQTITFAALANRALGAAPFVLSATASSGLAVTFLPNTTAVCTVSGVTVTLLTDGTCSITATQDGNTTWAPAPPITQTLTVAGKAQTITFGTVSSQILYGTPPILNANASSGLAVTFISNDTAVCTVSGATVTLVTPGTCSITATQDGNSTWAAAPPVTQTFMVII